MSIRPDWGKDPEGPVVRDLAIREIPNMKTDTRLILPSKERAAPAAEGTIQFIGNATVLIRYGGITILTIRPSFIVTNRCRSGTGCTAPG